MNYIKILLGFFVGLTGILIGYTIQQSEPFNNLISIIVTIIYVMCGIAITLPIYTELILMEE